MISSFTADEGRVLLFVPTAKDAEVTASLLGRDGLASLALDSVADLSREIRRGASVILLTQEAFLASDAPLLLEALRDQPEWSDLPIVLMLPPNGHSAAATGVLSTLTNVTLLERPSSLRTVLSAVQAAVRSRQRQYQLRSMLSRERAARLEAERANLVKDDFLATLSHELRTPLNPVLLLATEAADNPDLPDEVRRDFKTIAKNVALEARLIDDLLDLTRITRGKLSLSLEPASLHAVLADAVSTVASEIREKRLKLVTRFAPDSPTVIADPVRLQQVFWNILRNAVKFTPEGGRITVETSVTPDGLRAQVVVTDSGLGMTAGELGRVFNAFVQGDHVQPGAHKFGGLGLGLAISRMLVELHSGHISASSAGRDRGSEFVVQIPLQGSAHVGSRIRIDEPREHGLTSNGVKHILLVEDHEPTRTSLAYLLRRRHYEVTAAGSMSEALDVARSLTYDLLVTDLGLPDGDGYTLLSRLPGEQRPKAIALSGYGMEDDIRKSRDAGFLAHLTKPITVQDLEGALAVATLPTTAVTE